MSISVDEKRKEIIGILDAYNEALEAYSKVESQAARIAKRMHKAIYPDSVFYINQDSMHYSHSGDGVVITGNYSYAGNSEYTSYWIPVEWFSFEDEELFKSIAGWVLEQKEDQKRKAEEAERKAEEAKREKELALLSKLMNKYGLSIPESVRKEATNELMEEE